MECLSQTGQVYLYGVSGLSWSFIACLWLVNTWTCNERHSKPLQRMMSFVLIFKGLHCIFYSLMMASCQDGLVSPYWSLAITSTYTLYNTFIYTTLILISKGFCITREFLDRGEVTVVAMTMGAVYLGFSAFMIEREKLIPLLIVMLIVLFYLTIKFTKSIIIALIRRYQDLVAANARPMIPTVLKKITMMKTFLFLVYFFFIQQLLVIFLYYVGLALNSESYSLVIDTAAEAGDILGIAGIFFVFRSKDQGRYFDTNELPSSLQHQPIAPFMEAKIADDANLSELSADNPVVVLNPQDTKDGIFYIEAPYHYMLVAIPIRLDPMHDVAFVHVDNDLRQPLL